MDPIAESRWLYRWQDMEIPADASVDPSLRQLRESRVREDFLFNNQAGETQLHLQNQAVQIAAALVEGKGEIHFRLPEKILLIAARNGEEYTAEVPADFRDQRVAGFLNRIPVKDLRSAFRSRLTQLENSGYSGVQAGAALLRFAVVRHIVHDLPLEEFTAGLPAAIADSVSLQEGGALRTGGTKADANDSDFIRDGEAAILRLQRGLNTLHQAVSLAPYMYADEEYQAKCDVLLSRLLPLGYAVADCHVRDIVRTIRRRADANDLNRGLWLSVPYFDDRALELKMAEFEVIPPGRTMFAPIFVVLAAEREQEKIGQENSLSPSTRVHLLAELKSLEQAFDSRLR